MKILITGANGFVGRHLIHALAQTAEHYLGGTVFQHNPVENLPLHEVYPLDLRNTEAVYRLIAETRPGWIFHLAAQSFVPTSFNDPWGTLETNIRGSLNLLEALRRLDLKQTRLINVSTAAIYGKVAPEELPITETQPFNPGDPYAVSKVTQDVLGRQYHLAYGLDVVTARPFSHTGAGQDTRFVVADFANQIARIERGLAEPTLSVGNLSAERDYLDVRDVVQAYILLAQQGTSGEAYNICKGEGYTIQSFVDILLGMATVPITVTIDEKRFRPIDFPRAVGSPTKLKAVTGWEPQIAIDAMLRAVLDDYRRKYQ